MIPPTRFGVRKPPAASIRSAPGSATPINSYLAIVGLQRIAFILR